MFLAASWVGWTESLQQKTYFLYGENKAAEVQRNYQQQNTLACTLSIQPPTGRSETN